MATVTKIINCQAEAIRKLEARVADMRTEYAHEFADLQSLHDADYRRIERLEARVADLEQFAEVQTQHNIATTDALDKAAKVAEQLTRAIAALEHIEALRRKDRLQ